MIRLPTIQEWQLHRLLNSLKNRYHLYPHLVIIGFNLKPDGIDEVTFRGAQIVRTVPMNDKGLTYYRDTWFKLEHIGLEIPFTDKTLIVGFWCDDLPKLKQHMKEMLPDVDPNHFTERPLARQTSVEALAEPPPRG